MYRESGFSQSKIDCAFNLSRASSAFTGVNDTPSMVSSSGKNVHFFGESLMLFIYRPLARLLYAVDVVQGFQKISMSRLGRR